MEDFGEQARGGHDLGAWIIVAEEFLLGHNHDPEITRQLRALDRKLAPLWVRRTYRRPGGALETVGRHIIARLVDEPRGYYDRESLLNTALYVSAMPNPLPPELEGLGTGPYFESEVLEGPSPDGGLTPGPYLPMTYELVRRLEVAESALRRHTVRELDAQRIHRAKTAEQKKDRDDVDRFRQLWRQDRFRRRRRDGDLQVVPSKYGGKVGMSAQLMRLRKIARPTRRRRPATEAS